MASVGSDILASDFNTLRNTVVEVLGNGSGSYGYGQSVESATVSSGQKSLKAHFDAVKFDIYSAYIHQTGLTPVVTEAETTIPIKAGAGDPINQYSSITNDVRNNRFDAVLTSVIVKGNETYSSSWGTQAEAICTLNFSSADEARYYFNCGSKIRITSQRSGGTASSQNNAWSNILNDAGSRDFGAGTDPLINFYTLTNSYQQYYFKSTSTPYSANLYTLAARCNVANNNTGTATQVEIRIRLADDYVDLGPPSPGDVVDGNLEITVEELKAASLLKPSDTPFTITSPTFSLSTITAT